jgi:hypothetical protein
MPHLARAQQAVTIKAGGGSGKEGDRTEAEAAQSGVSPSMSPKLTSAPNSSRISTEWKKPCCAAIISGAAPSAFWPSVPSPHFKMYCAEKLVGGAFAGVSATPTASSHYRWNECIPDKKERREI